jgi:DHA1 family multidrug resistance protein-like MFS transporter
VALVASFVPAERVGFSLGLMQMAVYTGFSVGPLAGGLIADQVGYRWTFTTTGALLFVAGLLTVLVISERFVPPDDTQRRQQNLSAAARAVMSSLPMLGAVVALGGVYTANFAPFPIVPLFVEALQQTAERVNTTTGLVYGANALASAISAAVLGHLSDRTSYRTVLLSCLVGASLARIGQAFSPDIIALMVTSFVTGIFAGGIVPGANAILARIAPTEQRGAIYGISNSVNAAGRALGPLIGAAFVSIWGLRSAFVSSAVIFLLVTCWVLLAIRPEANRVQEG